VPTEAAVRNYFPQVATSIIPNDDNSRDLGSPSKRWAHVYVGPGSVTIGTLTLTDVAGTFTVSTDDSTPASLSVPEIDTGSVRYFQNNIIGTNSNEDIVVDTSGTGKLQVLTDINMTGTLSGPATFTIDPAAVGDNTGVVVIKGNLQVDGTTTTINSTTLSVADKNIVLAEGSTLDSQADGAGITIKGSTNKTLTWSNTSKAFTFNTGIDIGSVIENANITATALTGTQNINVLENSINFYTANNAANWTMNVRANSSVRLDAIMTTGESITVAYLATQLSANTFYQSAFQIDSTSVTPKFQGGTAPSAGNATSIDLYAFTIIKTAANTYTVLGSQTQYA
jgi:hypothetical protein